MEGMTYLAVAYLGMLVAIALWTYTVVQRSQRWKPGWKPSRRRKTHWSRRAKKPMGEALTGAHFQRSSPKRTVEEHERPSRRGVLFGLRSGPSALR